MTHLFAPKPQLVPFVNPSFSGGDLSGTFGSGGKGEVTAGSTRNDIVGGLSDAGAAAANTFGGLYNTVRPGFNDLLAARINSINDSARSAIGDLRQNLQSRRILGSSFGNDTISRANAEFSRQRDNTIADNFLKSLDAQRQLTADEYNARIKAFQPRLDELNLEAGLASDLMNRGSQQLAANAQYNASAQSAANASGLNALGSVIGTVGGLALKGLNFGGGGSPFSFGGGNITGGGYSFGGAPVDASSVFFV